MTTMMVKTLMPCAIAALALCTAGGAVAQKVYRCSPDGRVVYQQTPCADGKAVDASDPRTAEQRQAAQAVAKSEAEAAAKFDRDMAPPAPAKGSKTTKTQAAAADKPASSAKQASKKAEADAKPQVYLIPKPKDAASAAK